MQKFINSNSPSAKVISIRSQLQKVAKDTILSQKLTIPSSEGHLFIDFSDIIRLESASNYTRIFTKNGNTHMVSKTMKAIMELLPDQRFLRVHNSHVINLAFIELVTKDSIRLRDESQIPISRTNKKIVFERLGLS